MKPAHRCLLLLLASLALGACGKGKVEEKPPPDKLVILGSSWYGHLPAMYGIEAGIFERAGFEVEWKVVGSSAERMAQITSDQAQFASLGQVAMLDALKKGATDFVWVGSQDIAPGFEGIVTGPGVRSWEGLAGKTIGLPFISSVEMTVRTLLKQHQLEVGEGPAQVRLKNLPSAAVYPALRAGTIDAGAIWEPHFSKLKAMPGATVLALDTDTDIYRRFKTMTGPDILVLSRRWAEADRARAERLMTAYWASVSAVQQDPFAALEVAFRKYFRSKREVHERNLRKFVWLPREEQARVMSDKGLFAQTDFLIGGLLEFADDEKARALRYREQVDMGLVTATDDRR